MMFENDTTFKDLAKLAIREAKIESFDKDLGLEYQLQCTAYRRANEKAKNYAKAVTTKYRNRIVLYKNAKWIIERFQIDSFNMYGVFSVDIRKINKRTSNTLTYQTKYVKVDDLVITKETYKGSFDFF